jgi:hypothetical protein
MINKSGQKSISEDCDIAEKAVVVNREAKHEVG